MRKTFLAVAVVSATLAHAAEWRFDPVVSLNVQDNSNVLLVDGEPRSDRLASLAVDLAATRRTERGTVTLSYTPEHERYQDTSELDNTSHALRVGAAWRLTQRSAWDSSVSWTRRERARLSFDDVTQDLVALPPTQYDTATASLTGTVEQTQRLRWLWGASAASTRYDDPLVLASDVPLQDSRDLGVRFGIEGNLRETSRVRGELRFNRLDEGDFGERDVRRLLVGWTIGRIERLQLDISAGAAFNKLRDEGRLPADTATSSTDTVGSATLRGRIGAAGDMTVGVGRDVTNSLGTAGAALTDSAAIGFRRPIGRFSEFNLGARYADRKPLDDRRVLTATKTKAYRAEYRAALGPRWALVLAGEKVDQSSESGLASPIAEPGLAIDYQIFSLGLRWAPLSRGG